MTGYLPALSGIQESSPRIRLSSEPGVEGEYPHRVTSDPTNSSNALNCKRLPLALKGGISYILRAFYS